MFSSSDGDNHIFSPGTNASWSEWFDITADTNAPRPWTWTDVDNLGDVESHSTTIWPFTLYCSKVEIRVTHTIP